MSKRTLEYHLAAGRLKSVKYGGLRRIERSAIADFLDAHREDSIPPRKSRQKAAS